MAKDEVINTRKRDMYEDELSREKAVYNPIIGQEKEDEGIDPKIWKEKQHLKSQGN
jgi:hypothetical protein